MTASADVDPLFRLRAALAVESAQKVLRESTHPDDHVGHRQHGGHAHHGLDPVGGHVDRFTSTRRSVTVTTTHTTAAAADASHTVRS